MLEKKFHCELTYSATLPVALRPVSAPKTLTLLLHGYGYNGTQIYSKLIDYLPEDTYVVAPSAPLYTPVQRGKSYHFGHSWYFWDLATDSYVIEERISLEYIDQLFARENVPTGIPMQIIGFSQGGYFAPFVGLKYSNCERVINIGGSYLADRLRPESTRFPLFGIHGEADEVVDCAGAKANHQSLISRGCQGEFYAYPGLGHDYHNEFREKVRELSL